MPLVVGMPEFDSDTPTVPSVASLADMLMLPAVGSVMPAVDVSVATPEFDSLAELLLLPLSPQAVRPTADRQMGATSFKKKARERNIRASVDEKRFKTGGSKRPRPARRVHGSSGSDAADPSGSRN
jgi:hypothetical protein